MTPRAFADALYAKWREFWPQTNLLMPDLKAEIMITIDWEGQSRVFFTKVDSQADIAQIATAIIQAGINLGESRGLRLKFGKPPTASDAVHTSSA